MKGVVFTEFMDMVETSFGEEQLDLLLEEADSDGVYTAVGTYPHSEMVNLVVVLSKQTGKPIGELLEFFGNYMFQSFTRLYPSFFKEATTSFDFLERVEDYIHVEVLKIYPEAELPRFQTHRISDKQLQMIYKSERSMGMLAVGLIRGCLRHYQETGDVIIEGESEDGSHVTFLVEIE